MSRSAAPPVPPPAAFTLIATALRAVLPVLIVPALCVKPVAPAPSVFALIKIAPAPEVMSAPMSTRSWPDRVIVPAPPAETVPLVLSVPAPFSVTMMLPPPNWLMPVMSSAVEFTSCTSLLAVLVALNCRPRLPCRSATIPYASSVSDGPTIVPVAALA